MPRTTLPIANGFYRSDSLPASAQDCVNCYPVIENAPALAAETLRGCPGILELSDSGQDSIRGAHILDGNPYIVADSTLYSVTGGGVLTAISGSISGTGPVSMAQNGTELFILEPGGSGYTYDAVSGLVEVTDGDFTANGNPTAVAFVDGYFVFTTDSNKIIVSNLNDGQSYNALDFGSVESSPDDVVAPVIFRNQLYIGGERTTEVFSNIGGAGFPFERVNVFLEQGFASRFSAQVALNSLLFLGAGTNEQPGVWASSGNTTEKISTRAIDEILRPLTTTELEAITSWAYSQSGHYFVGWNLPGTTIVYDLSTGRWHERQSRIEIATNEYTTKAWRGRYPVTADGVLYICDSESGKVGRLDPDTYKEFGSIMIRQFTTQPFQNNMAPFFVPMLELTVESGVGTETLDPQVVLSRSRDGGRSFSYERARSMGKRGEYHRRAIWRRNGRVDTTDVYRFTMSDPVKFAALQLTADVE